MKRSSIIAAFIGFWAWWWEEIDIIYDKGHWYTYFAAVNIACLGFLLWRSR